MRDAPEPDGERRCWGHSKRPELIAKREVCAEQGRTQGAKQKQVPKAARPLVNAGVIPLEDARQAKIVIKAPRAEVSPVDLRSRDAVLVYLGQVAGELSGGAVDAKEASAAAALARTALVALGADLPDEGEKDERPRGFRYQTTGGKVLSMAGRDAGAN